MTIARTNHSLRGNSNMSLLAFVCVVLLIYSFFKYLLEKPHPKFPPGPLRWPIWGGYLQLLWENYKFPYRAMHNMARRYKSDLLGLYLGPFPTVIACSQAAVREMLMRPEFQGRVDAFVPRNRDPDGIIRGQFFADGHRWVEQRRFMLRNLRDFGFGTRSKTLEKIIEEEVRDFIHSVQTEKNVEAPSVFYPVFLNISLELLLGARLPPHQQQRLRAFALHTLRFQKAVDPSTGIINMTPWVRHFIPDSSGYTDCVSANNEIKKFIQELINEHKETFMSDALRDYCDVYLQEMKNKDSCETQHWFEEAQMVMTMWDLLFPSAMAVTATMAYTLEFLLRHPEVQPKIHKELDEVVGESRLPTLDDRKNLHYVEAFLREVMRRETLTPLSLPHRSTEDTYFQGYFIPKDTVLLPNLWSSHMDESVWGDPLKFEPEKHLDKDGKLKKKDLTIPFGLGKRVCAGETFARQNMFLVFTAMLQHFRVELPAGEALVDMEDRITGINVAPKPFRVNLVAR